MDQLMDQAVLLVVWLGRIVFWTRMTSLCMVLLILGTSTTGIRVSKFLFLSAIIRDIHYNMLHYGALLNLNPSRLHVK